MSERRSPTLFYVLAVVFALEVAAVAVVSLAGCGFLENLQEAPEATTAVGDAVTEVLAVPSNPFAWVKLIAAVTGLVAVGIWGKKKLSKKSTTVDTPTTP